MKSLYPQIEPYKTEFLKVSDLHTLYLEQSGNPQGIPVIGLHGGPGAKSKPDHRRIYDPQKYRIILFDQRGCGQSSPSGELTGNTTQELVEDIEKIRIHLGVEKWIVTGGSWGSTLALAYAQYHPAGVMRLILRSIFLCRKWERDWLWNADIYAKVFPDIWEQYIGLVPERERDNLFEAYEKMLFGSNTALRDKAFRILSLLEDARQRLVSGLDVGGIGEDVMTDNDRDSYGILFHYMHHDMFLKENQLLSNVQQIRQIPTDIVHGRYDMCCPLQSAWDLHKAFPEAKLHIVPAASHKASEPGIVDKLIEITDGLFHK